MKTDIVSEFYDKYSERQIKSGVNERHKSILSWLNKFGLQKGHSVLEIGCGIGTVTSLLAKYLSNSGHVLAVDLSKKSIKIARQRINKKNVKFIDGDILDMDIKDKYDVILLPDVIEHIPLDKHPLLFKKLSNLLKDNGMITIHIPDPHYLAWFQHNKIKNPQIIENPVYTDQLASAIEETNLKISYLESYCIWTTGYDYQIIKLEKVNKTYKPKHNRQTLHTLYKKMKHKIKRSF
ncbi:MAG: class I SAM-dependent methyltransferase [bacterium]